jgi:hypothetical protein
MGFDVYELRNKKSLDSIVFMFLKINIILSMESLRSYTDTSLKREDYFGLSKEIEVATK